MSRVLVTQKVREFRVIRRTKKRRHQVPDFGFVGLVKMLTIGLVQFFILQPLHRVESKLRGRCFLATCQRNQAGKKNTEFLNLEEQESLSLVSEVRDRKNTRELFDNQSIFAESACLSSGQIVAMQAGQSGTNWHLTTWNRPSRANPDCHHAHSEKKRMTTHRLSGHCRGTIETPVYQSLFQEHQLRIVHIPIRGRSFAGNNRSFQC